MAWYWVVLIIVAVQCLFLLVWWLLTRGSGVLVADLKEALKQSRLKRVEEELAIEKKTKEQVIQELNSLTKDYKAIIAWYEENKGKIVSDAKTNYKELVADPDLLDAKLDSLLGTGTGTVSVEEG